MRVPVVRSLAVLAVPVVAVLLASSASAARQAPPDATDAAPGAEWKAPRTAYGHPEIQGVWSFATYTPMERPAQFAGKEFFTPDEAKAFYDSAADRDYNADPNVHYDPTEYGLDRWQNGARPSLRTSQIVDPPDGRFPPLTPETKEWLSRQSRERGLTPQSREIYERCIAGYWGRGLLNLTGGGGLDSEQEIVQTPSHILIVSQSNNDLRIIPLDGRPHVSSGITPWFGDSRGRWEGESLVVETTNFDPAVRYRGLPMANVKVVERFTRVGQDALQYRLTAEDPTVWTQPWTAEVVWPRRPGPIFEFACHEMNYGLVNVLRGELAAAKNGARASRSGAGGGD